jgi:hypothetical protein
MIVRRGVTWESIEEICITCNVFGMPVVTFPQHPADTLELTFYARDDFSPFFAKG